MDDKTRISQQYTYVVVSNQKIKNLWFYIVHTLYKNLGSIYNDNQHIHFNTLELQLFILNTKEDESNIKKKPTKLAGPM